MVEHISSIVVFPSGFKIRSKADAERFIKEMVAQGSDVCFLDVNDPSFYYVVTRAKNGGQTSVAHISKTHLWYEPTLMLKGREAIDMVYAGRKSFNKKFFDMYE